jgi:hypothetical protein
MTQTGPEMDGPRHEFQDFVADLSRAVSVHWAPLASPPAGAAVAPLFAPDDPRIVWEWPDPVGRVIEELRKMGDV